MDERNELMVQETELETVEEQTDESAVDMRRTPEEMRKFKASAIFTLTLLFAPFVLLTVMFFIAGSYAAAAGMLIAGVGLGYYNVRKVVKYIKAGAPKPTTGYGSAQMPKVDLMKKARWLAMKMTGDESFMAPYEEDDEEYYEDEDEDGDEESSEDADSVGETETEEEKAE